MTDTATPRTRSRSSRRRSHPNLHHLSLAPLSSKYPLDGSAPPSPSADGTRTPPSYIANHSLPSTPGILSLSQSRSNSRSRRRAKTPTASASAYVYDGYFLSADAPARGVGEIPKAKSTSVLLTGVATASSVMSGEGRKRQHERKRTGELKLARFHTTDEAADEWLHRAGLAIAGEMRESKGQSWLVRRASSTSLVRQSDGWDEHRSHEHEGPPLMKLISGEHFEGDGTGFTSPRALSRFGSRAGSRIHSARGSRRGSRVFSKFDLMTTAGSPQGVVDEGYFGEEILEPDFVEGDEESVGDEEEVARLARERGFGLGGWMDKLIGWTLFRVEEDGESDEDEDGDDGEDSLTKEEIQLKREVEAKRKKMERETIIAASAAGAKQREVEESKEAPIAQPMPAEGEGGWQDAAWLLSVASKVLL